jgi:hypothetical protein
MFYNTSPFLPNESKMCYFYTNFERKSNLHQILYLKPKKHGSYV